MTRLPSHAKSRPGITLTEILISILIMGVGLISLATLFPLGLLRLRAAARDSRSALLGESALADLQARNMLSKASVTNPYVATWYAAPNLLKAPVANWPAYDPFVTDGIQNTVAAPLTGVTRDPALGSYGPGLPICYDPLWRVVAINPTTQAPGIYPTQNNALHEARFASGIGFLRPDPAGGNFQQVSAHGLQRVFNFPLAGIPTNTSNPTAVNGFLQSQLGAVFASPDDIVYNPVNPTGTNLLAGQIANYNGVANPILPDMTLTATSTPVVDWNYSWFFTGNQVDGSDGTAFSGSIVVCNNRPIGMEEIQSPFGNREYVADGEQVVEGIFGYGAPATVYNGYGYAALTSRTLLLRWPAQLTGNTAKDVPDPEVRVGGWIADVTYQRYAANDLTFNKEAASVAEVLAQYPLQRCHWYQVSRKTASEDEVVGSTPAPATAGYKRMTVTVTTPFQALTLLNATTNAPVHTNAALVMPSVVNVFPKTIVTH